MELLSLKWNNHRTTFFHVLTNLRAKEVYTDVTLVCQGQFFPVHKLVLAICSDYFSDVFENTTCKAPVVIINGMELKNLQYLLDYMYLGEVQVPQAELASLIEAAKSLQIKGLVVPDEDSATSTRKRSQECESVQQSKKQKTQDSDCDSICNPKSEIPEAEWQSHQEEARTPGMTGDPTISEEQGTPVSSQSMPKQEQPDLPETKAFEKPEIDLNFIGSDQEYPSIFIDSLWNLGTSCNKEFKTAGPSSSIQQLHMLKKKFGNRTNPIPDDTIRTDGFHHFPEMTPKQRVCKQPICRHKTHIRCTKCDIYLCLTQERNCFVNFHTN